MYLNILEDNENLNLNHIYCSIASSAEVIHPGVFVYPAN